MPAQAEHQSPIGKTDTLDTWRKRMRIPVPSKAGGIVDVQIAALYETTTMNGLPLDALIEGRTTKDKPLAQFGVVFSSRPPEWDAYGIPVLWIDDTQANVGRWKGMVR